MKQEQSIEKDKYNFYDGLPKINKKKNYKIKPVYIFTLIVKLTSYQCVNKSFTHDILYTTISAYK